MARTHVTFRLSDEAMQVLVMHQARLSADQKKDVDRTTTLEDILFKFDSQGNPVARLKRALRRHPTPSFEKGDRPLEGFITA